MRNPILIALALLASISFSQAQNEATLVDIKPDCNCLTFNPKATLNFPPAFSGGNQTTREKVRNQANWKKYSPDSVRLKVKMIVLRDMDTIPEKLAVFENVEIVYLINRKGVTTGLDIFPKLKMLNLSLSIVEFDTTEHWLKRIEVLNLEMTRIKGLTSFTLMPNLVELNISGGSFDQFPADIESLTCLNKLTLNSYLNNKPFDLSQIDISKLKCLKEAEFSAPVPSFTGIPAGLDNAKNVMLKVTHKNLTREEKRKLKQYDKRVKKQIGKGS